MMVVLDFTRSIYYMVDNDYIHVLLPLLFNVMLMHGYTPVDLLQSSIISIPKN